MRVEAVHSHLHGHEWLLIHEPALWDEVLESIEAVHAKREVEFRTVVKSYEDRYASAVDNARIASMLVQFGWHDATALPALDPDLEKATQKSIGQSGSIQQDDQSADIDLIKNAVAMKTHFAASARGVWFASHLAFYVGNIINVGIEILPMKAMQEQMSSGIGYYEGTLYDMARQGRGVPAVPLVIIGVVP